MFFHVNINVLPVPVNDMAGVELTALLMLKSVIGSVMPPTVQSICKSVYVVPNTPVTV